MHRIRLQGQLLQGQLLQDKDEAFDCAEDMSLLIAMGRAGIKSIPVGCRAGGCGVCKIRILEGHYDTKIMSQAKVSLQEQEEGYALACRVFPRSDLLVNALPNDVSANGVSPSSASVKKASPNNLSPRVSTKNK